MLPESQRGFQFFSRLQAAKSSDVDCTDINEAAGSSPRNGRCDCKHYGFADYLCLRSPELRICLARERTAPDCRLYYAEQYYCPLLTKAIAADREVAGMITPTGRHKVSQCAQGICPLNASECFERVGPLTPAGSLTASKAFGGRAGKKYSAVSVISSIIGLR